MNAGNATKRDTTILVVTPDGRMPEWGPRGEDVVLMAGTGDERALADLLASAGAAAIDAGVESPLAIGRRIHGLDPDVQLIFVVPPGVEAEFRRSMTFHPGLGEPWVVEPGEAVPALFARATGIARRRESRVARLSSLSEQVARLQADAGRTRMSDRYLATVLELLPDPVVALDEEDRILFANSAAEVIMGGDAGEPASRLRLSTADLRDLLERARGEPARGRIVLREGEGAERIYDAAVAPVAGARPVRVLVLHEVTERERLLDERERLLDERDHALEELRTAMRHRSRFYRSMSHELRTPLNALMGYNALLLEGVLGELPEGQRDAVERMDRSGRHLLELVDDVLDLSKVEAGKLALDRRDVSLRELLSDLEVMLKHMARERRSEMRFHVHESCGDRVRTDPRRVRQILMNLLSNAIRYGGGRPVDVRCRAEGDTLVVEVEDRGPGIPRDRTEEIFEEFVQVGEEDDGGTGLGLAIARTLARHLGGDVTVESEPGKGSRFLLTLPGAVSP